MAARAACLVLLCLPMMLQGQYDDLPDTHLYPLQPQYAQYDTQLGAEDYNPDFDYTGTNFETEPTEPGPLDCREEQYPCTRLYSVHRPCKQCLKSLCFYSVFLGSGKRHAIFWQQDPLVPPLVMGIPIEATPAPPGSPRQGVPQRWDQRIPPEWTAREFQPSLRRVYVVNKEVCVRTVCAHEELLRADLCRDKYAKCGVMATSGLCGQMASSCDKSCGSC